MTQADDDVYDILNKLARRKGGEGKHVLFYKVGSEIVPNKEKYVHLIDDNEREILCVIGIDPINPTITVLTTRGIVHFDGGILKKFLYNDLDRMNLISRLRYDNYYMERIMIINKLGDHITLIVDSGAPFRAVAGIIVNRIKVNERRIDKK